MARHIRLAVLALLLAPLAACAGDAPGARPEAFATPRQEGGIRLGFAPQAGTETFQVSEFNAEDEAAIGAATARHLLARHELLPPEHPLALHVRKVGALLSMGATRPELRYRFAVLVTPELDSCAAPDGWVFITTGLLRFLENEAELAFVLAHEICHVEHRDGLEMLARAQADLAKRAMRDRLAALASRPAEEVEKELQARMDELSDMVLRGKGLPQEIRADAFALRLVQRAGYDPGAAAELFRRLAALQEPGLPQPLIFRSHPHLTERAATAAKDAARLPAGGALLAERFLAAVGALPAAEEGR